MFFGLAALGTDSEVQLKSQVILFYGLLHEKKSLSVILMIIFWVADRTLIPLNVRDKRQISILSGSVAKH